ncbi:NarK family nitrate/nitrite MFS transporter [Serratia odorifera]|uniref:Nitrate/nitrite transporter n=2 Tax=Serratia odorifera TaxID=618 RepID=D4E7U2_SEROD|nr:NarK family nitrate/nitrite MFS transporter [Serratia odorifera]EFE94147.1 nitrite extrusion protein 1 [Serratia odorifera DSM 4582]PNK88991.1 NarK family nitrate/nitrite MFS transporter [Serratia odorifera]RII69981.1 NarK family nitrate/nitrite MFS transporter [Serratia odorifera]VDZ64434.1 Nitrite facilitator 1 [Serratia odorifera]
MSQLPKTDDRAEKGVLSIWNPEDPQFWQHTGQGIARRNLWISIPSLLLAFCVWMLFSAVAINLNRVGFSFSTDELFMLTALPSLAGAFMRVPYSFVIPIFGGRRWTAFSTLILVIPCLWLGFAVQNPATPYWVFVVISLMCGVAGANFASSMANISFFFPKSHQGGALGLNGGLGNLGVSVMQLVAPLVVTSAIFGTFAGGGHATAEGETLWLQNAAFVWVIPLAIFAVAAWFGMNDIAAAKASLGEQLPVLKRLHMWVMALLYLATFGSFIGFSAGFAMLTKTQFPEVSIAHYAFWGPMIGALARPVGGALADRFGGARVTVLNFAMMSIFAALIFLTLPGTHGGGSFLAFFLVFLGLFLTAGLGSGSTFQMISIIFRFDTTRRVKANGGSDEEAAHEAATDSAAALGFISAIGAVGGFFIPKTFGTSLALTGAADSAMKVFLVFYVVCTLVTWWFYIRTHIDSRK